MRPGILAEDAISGGRIGEGSLLRIIERTEIVNFTVKPDLRLQLEEGLSRDCDRGPQLQGASPCVAVHARLVAKGHD